MKPAKLIHRYLYIVTRLRICGRSLSYSVKNFIPRRLTNFPGIYPDFMPTPVWGRRNALREELERADMMERRMRIDIPEFYVGSIVAVTSSDRNMSDRKIRFLGICISRDREGLQHRFTLRNVIDGLGVEIMYEMYNPTILKIETIRLEKRLDDDLTYLIDALSEYSRFDINMEPVPHTIGQTIPINETKVKLRNPPWQRRWELYDYKGIDFCWSLSTPYFKRKFYQKTKVNSYRKYDLIADHRAAGTDLETEWLIEDEMRKFDEERQKRSGTKRRILHSATEIIQ